MLELKDFLHLPELDVLFDQIVADPCGLIIVVGLDPRPHAQTEGITSCLPSGRFTIFRILMRQCLMAHPKAKAVVIAEQKGSIRVPRGLRSRVDVVLAPSPGDCAELLQRMILRRPELLVVDRLCE